MFDEVGVNLGRAHVRAGRWPESGEDGKAEKAEEDVTADQEQRRPQEPVVVTDAGRVEIRLRCPQIRPQIRLR
ncbi:hypothetical protein GII33_15055 [Gordonia pseudamarae]|uniref:Transposase n=1 Tax=Gordonia pseudamarae TaxID=2831662 RepID=A0ABX6IKU2_9ACTN|nr:hypothetical protein GII33_15055 [Gordonia pseudamarae]QHN35961.1 hypothetical protein GII31_14880 [Gordonia pseudamarae]